MIYSMWRINPTEKRWTVAASPHRYRSVLHRSLASHPIIPSIILFSRIINSLGSARVCTPLCTFPLPWNFRQANHPRETDNGRHDDGGVVRPHENGAPQDVIARDERRKELETGSWHAPFPPPVAWRQETSEKLSVGAIRQDELLIPTLRVALRQAESFCRQ